MFFYANAGISGGRVPLFEQPVELWQEVLRVNLIGPFLAIKHAGPVMVRQGTGSIVCTASVAGLRANAGGPPYAASKAGSSAWCRRRLTISTARACASTPSAPA